MSNTFFKIQNSTKEISVIIPAYNEVHRICPTLDSIFTYFSNRNTDFEVIVVDDGSTDEMSEFLKKKYANVSELVVIRYPENKGKGHAVLTGVKSSSGALIIFIDADGSSDINEFSKLEDAVKKGSDIAIGSRAMPNSGATLKAKFFRVVLGRIFNFFVNMLCVPEISDTQCGFKLFRREAAGKIFSKQTIHGFAFDCELLFIARKHDLLVSEISINWLNIDGSKVNLLTDPIKMMLEITKIRINEKRGMYR